MKILCDNEYIKEKWNKIIFRNPKSKLLCAFSSGQTTLEIKSAHYEQIETCIKQDLRNGVQDVVWEVMELAWDMHDY